MKVKMAEVESETLREMTNDQLLSVRNRLIHDDVDLDIDGILEAVDMLMQSIVLLDSFERVSQDVFTYMMRARDALSGFDRNTTEHRLNLGAVGRPSFDIKKSD